MYLYNVEITSHVEGEESELEALALDKRLVFPAASTCVCIMKGRNTVQHFRVCQLTAPAAVATQEGPS